MRAGLASSGGMVGAAPRRPAHRQTLRSTAGERIIAIKQIKSGSRLLTLFMSLCQRVEQHLEGSGVAEACEYLHGCRIGEESFTPVYSLERKETKRRLRTRPTNNQTIFQRKISINLKSSDEPAPL